MVVRGKYNTFIQQMRRDFPGAVNCTHYDAEF
jgi:hypothetical protein